MFGQLEEAKSPPVHILKIEYINNSRLLIHKDFAAELVGCVDMRYPSGIPINLGDCPCMLGRSDVETRASIH